MVTLFQLFEFSYPNGLLFFDRAGLLSRRLQDLLPGLTLKNSSRDQLDFTLPANDLELLFGISLARIQTLSPDKKDFPKTVSDFLRTVTEVLEISQLKDFHFRYVLGKPCVSEVEAHELMWPLVPEEAKAKMSALAEPPQWQAIQAEFLHGNLAFQSRIAILYLVPHEKLFPSEAKAGKQIPHITYQLDIRGLVAIGLAEFDVESFMKNVCEKYSREILAKLAPHLS